MIRFLSACVVAGVFALVGFSVSSEALAAQVSAENSPAMLAGEKVIKRATPAAKNTSPKLEVNVTGAGVINSLPAGVNCIQEKSPCRYTVRPRSGNQKVVLTAKPSDGQEVEYMWVSTRRYLCQPSRCVIEVKKDTTVNVSFRAKPTGNNPFCLARDPAGKCSRWVRKTTGAYYQGSPIAWGALLRIESWYEGASWAEAGNTVKVKVSGAVNALRATRIGFFVFACGNPVYSSCVDQKTNEGIEVPAGVSTFERFYSFTLKRKPVATSASLITPTQRGGVSIAIARSTLTP